MTVVVEVPRVKFTVTVFAVVRITVQELVAIELQPVHEIRCEPDCGTVFRIMLEFATNDEVQMVPQFMPAGVDVAAPCPVPCLVTVRV